MIRTLEVPAKCRESPGGPTLAWSNPRRLHGEGKPELRLEGEVKPEN